MKKLLYLLSKKLEIVWCINELNNYCNISFTISMEMKRDKNHCLQTNYTVKKCASLLVELNNFRPRKIWERRGSGKWSRTVCKCANDDWSATFDRNACTIIGAIGNWMRGVNRSMNEIWSLLSLLKYGRRIRSIDSPMFTDFLPDCLLSRDDSSIRWWWQFD